MAVYAVGDLQGCLDPFLALLERIDFDPALDRLWLAGDLVSRGPQSLETLRYVRDLGDAAVAVLGNHDLNLLGVAYGVRDANPKDRLEPILRAPDRDALLEWLRRRPLLHHDAALGYTLVHAGFAPQWDLPLAQACAREVEQVLRGPDYGSLLENMYGNQPDHWDAAGEGWDRLRFAINCFTRLRYVDESGRIDLKAKGAPRNQARGLHPWFQAPGRRSRDAAVVFGHWSALGIYLGDNVSGLDSGCVWGGHLSALRLDRKEPVVYVSCPQAQAPGER